MKFLLQDECLLMTLISIGMYYIDLNELMHFELQNIVMRVIKYGSIRDCIKSLHLLEWLRERYSTYCVKRLEII